jgi:NADPH:quinone reductase-like Zn-dependent oxidoreductase
MITKETKLDDPLAPVAPRDVSGVARAVGTNVKHFKPGERVFALSNATYAELVAVPYSDVTHLPVWTRPQENARRSNSIYPCHGCEVLFSSGQWR